MWPGEKQQRLEARTAVQRMYKELTAALPVESPPPAKTVRVPTEAELAGSDAE